MTGHAIDPTDPAVNRRNASDVLPNAVVTSALSNVPVRTASTGFAIAIRHRPRVSGQCALVTSKYIVWAAGG